MILILSKKYDICFLAKLAINFKGKSYSCNCVKIKNLSEAVKYVCKLGSYTSDIKNLYDEALLPVDQFLRNMSHTEGSKKTLQF